MKMIHSEILVSVRRAVELSRTTENQLVLEAPENVTFGFCFSFLFFYQGLNFLFERIPSDLLRPGWQSRVPGVNC